MIHERAKKPVAPYHSLLHPWEQQALRDAVADPNDTTLDRVMRIDAAVARIKLKSPEKFINPTNH